ncbi:MAG: hypothetical protein K6U78_04150 [Anaerolineae bacterium]|jgi:hypothetical protein|nr:hypothetical protein [Anaerolineae bacterium]
MLRKIDDKLHDLADRVFEALGYHRHPPPVRLTRIVIVRVPGHEPTPHMNLAPARMQPSALIARRRF